MGVVINFTLDIKTDWVNFTLNFILYSTEQTDRVVIQGNVESVENLVQVSIQVGYVN